MVTQASGDAGQNPAYRPTHHHHRPLTRTFRPQRQLRPAASRGICEHQIDGFSGGPATSPGGIGKDLETAQVRALLDGLEPTSANQVTRIELAGEMARFVQREML